MRTLLTLGWNFLWISTVTLGGGMAMLPLMERAFVEKRRWLSTQEMVDIIAVMQSLPGLIAVNMAVLIGYRVKGVAGALVSSVASVLVPFAAIVLVASGLSALGDSPALAHVFLGVRAGTAALVLGSLVRLAAWSLSGFAARVLAVGSFVAAVVLGVDVALIIVFGMLVGLGLIVANAWKEVRG